LETQKNIDKPEKTLKNQKNIKNQKIFKNRRILKTQKNSGKPEEH
jgi:hypothetical protein